MFESSLLFGLAVALGWGLADLGNKRLVQITGAYGAILPLQVLEVLGGLLVVLVTGHTQLPEWSALVWSFFGALLFNIGWIAYFRSLAVMPVSVAVGLLATVALVPLSWELFTGGLVITGFQLGILLMVLVGAALAAIDTDEVARAGAIRLVIGLPIMLVAVLAFGGAFILLDNSTATIGWQRTYFFLQIFQLVQLLVYFALTGKFSLVKPYRGRWLYLALLPSIFAFVALHWGMTVGSVGVITGIANLSVGITAILSYLILKEKLGIVQYAGLGITVLALALLSF